MTSVRKTRSETGNNTIFDQAHLVLVEGTDDQAVIVGLISTLDLDGFQVHDMGGKDGWIPALLTFSKSPDFQVNVNSLGLVRDADANPVGVWNSCKSALTRAGLPLPSAPAEIAVGQPNTAVLIVPGSGARGAIEELCLRSLEPERMTCVDGYFDCLGMSAATRSGKGKLQVYLGGQADPVRDLTVAVAKGRLDLRHPAFDDARSFLRNLTKQAAGC